MLEDDKKMPIEAEPESTPKRTYRESKGLDEAFINAYCNRPLDGKKAAVIEAGFTGDNAGQEAYRMYKRLEPQIKARTTELIASLDTLAAEQLKGILTSPVEDVGYANMSKAIQQGLDYSGRKQSDTLEIVTTELTQEQRRERIEYLQDKNQQAATTKH